MSGFICKTMGYGIRHSILGLISAIFGLVTAGSALAADLMDVRFGPDGEKTRLVIDLDGAPDDYAIGGDATGAGRIIIEFSGLSAPASLRTLKKGKGHIGSFQFTQLDGGDVRAVFDLRKSAKIKEAFLLEPKNGVKKHRLVIDLQTAGKKAFMASLPKKKSLPDLASKIEEVTAPPQKKPVAQQNPYTQQPLATKTPEAKTAEQTAPKRAPAPSLAPPIEKQIVVIDPGHGGADPGAIGPSGLLEKTVTLAAALELKKMLEKSGRYKVVLTRDKDKKMLPSQREDLARKAGADLFISLHADALDQRKVRGASVYTLSKQGSQRSAREAREQGNYVINDTNLDKEVSEEVGGLLFQLTQRETNNNSSAFAEALIENLNGVVPMLNRSHRTGDLRVLLAPDVPAVLLEMAFISNPQDETNLKSAKWRKKTMKAVSEAIDQYFEESRLARHAARQAGGAR